MLFDATLDARTCPFCGAMDGKIWSVDALVDVRRPPLHMNCRCCLVPHIDLRDKDGNVLELGERPAANADFDKLAEEQYNADAKAKGLKRRFKDLAQSTRLKYYYQAQKDFEKRTGKPAYRQVAGNADFKTYFESQDDAFKRSWLGAKRYDLYKSGALNIDEYLKPSRFYTARVVDLQAEENERKESERAEREAAEAAEIDEATKRKTFSFKEPKIVRDVEAIKADARKFEREYYESEFARSFAIEQNRIENEYVERNPQPTREEFEAKYKRGVEKKYDAAWDEWTRKWKESVEFRAQEEIGERSRQAALDAQYSALFPVDERQSENRRTLRALCPNSIRFGDEIRKREIREQIERGLDFVGRVFDNAGVDVSEVFKREYLLKERGLIFVTNEEGRYKDIFSSESQRIYLGVNSDADVRSVAQTVAHEIGHAIEFHFPELRERLREALERFTRDENGEENERVRLREADPLGGYPADEWCWKTDKKIEPYAVKRFFGRNTSELLSMFLGEIYRAPSYYPAKYSDHYDAVLSAFEKTNKDLAKKAAKSKSGEFYATSGDKKPGFLRRAKERVKDFFAPVNVEPTFFEYDDETKDALQTFFDITPHTQKIIDESREIGRDFEKMKEFVQDKLGITPNFIKKDAPEFTENVFGGIIDYTERFGLPVNLREIRVAPLADRTAYGLFTEDNLTITIRETTFKNFIDKFKKDLGNYRFSTDSEKHIIRHELGHSLCRYLSEYDVNYGYKLHQLQALTNRLQDEEKFVVSGRSKDDEDEFMAELIAFDIKNPSFFDLKTLLSCTSQSKFDELIDGISKRITGKVLRTKRRPRS